MTRALLFLLVLTGLRLAYIGQVELSPDEAYYQMWSERLDWGYYSKGPGVAAIIRAGTTLFGVNEFGVRFFSPLCALGTSLLLFWLVRRLYDERAAWFALVLVNVTPIFQAGALLMTIDAPSVFFWTAALCAQWLALETRSLRWHLATGALIGLGILCKYTNAVELIGIALALWWVGRRQEFGRAGFWLMLATAAVVASPPFIWNARHAWITMNHLRARGSLEDAHFAAPLREFGQFWAGQFGVYSPLIFAGLLVALWLAARRGQMREKFLLAFAAPLIVMYGLLAFKTSGEPNWTAPAYVSGSALAAVFFAQRARAWGAAALGVGLLCSIVILNTDAVRAIGIPWPYERDPAARLLGWQATADAVATARTDAERDLGAPVFLIANRYQLAAELNFYLPATARRLERAGDPPVYLPESQNIETQFSLWPGYDQFETSGSAPAAPKNAEEEFAHVGGNPLAGHSALYLSDDEKARRVPSSIESGFEETKLIAQYEIRRRGQPLRHLRVFACFGYKGLEL